MHVFRLDIPICTSFDHPVLICICLCSQWKDGILYSVLEEILLRLVLKKESPEEPQWLIIDGPCSTQDLLRIIHPDGLLRVPNKKVIKLPTELKIIVESSNPTESSVPVILMSSVDIGWEAMLKVEMKRAKVGKLVQSILRKAVSEVIDFLNAACTSPEQLAVLTFKLFQVHIYMNTYIRTCVNVLMYALT